MLRQQQFGHMPDGTPVAQFTLGNKQGVEVDILSLGGIIRSWRLPGKDARPLDIVLGFDTLAGYLADQAYLGALIGRYANRIKHGRFSLQGKSYQVDVNQGGNCLHGGSNGFNRRVWQAEILHSAYSPALALALCSEDGDQGFPGKLETKVVYTLGEDNTLRIEYFAKADQTTLYNPTQHTYFNLAGHRSGTIASHEVQLLASQYIPTDANAIPTGEFADVSDTPFDLRNLTPVSLGLASEHQQISFGNGYDHNWCLDGYEGELEQPKLAAVAVETVSGRKLSVRTTMPGMQLYTANYLGSDPIGKDGVAYQPRGGLCFETQFYPDSPNQPHFPSPLLLKDKAFYAVTEYQIN
jgi:aldose 1-epimerase